MSHIMVYFLHSTSVLPVYIDGVLTLSVGLQVWYSGQYCILYVFYIHINCYVLLIISITVYFSFFL